MVSYLSQINPIILHDEPHLESSCHSSGVVGCCDYDYNINDHRKLYKSLNIIKNEILNLIQAKDDESRDADEMRKRINELSASSGVVLNTSSDEGGLCERNKNNSSSSSSNSSSSSSSNGVNSGCKSNCINLGKKLSVIHFCSEGFWDIENHPLRAILDVRDHNVVFDNNYFSASSSSSSLPSSSAASAASACCNSSRSMCSDIVLKKALEFRVEIRLDSIKGGIKDKEIKIFDCEYLWRITRYCVGK